MADTSGIVAVDRCDRLLPGPLSEIKQNFLRGRTASGLAVEGGAPVKLILVCSSVLERVGTG